MDNIRPRSQPLAYSVKDAAQAVGISPAKLEQIIARGDINPRWVDGKRIIAHGELLAWIDTLPFEKPA